MRPKNALKIQDKLDELNKDKEAIPALVEKWHKKSYEMANKVHDESVKKTVAV